MGKNYAVIVAAGKGKRMKCEINKQFLNIDNKPVLYYSLNTFSKHPSIDGIVLVCSQADIEYCKKNIIEKYSMKKIYKIVMGGKERQDSVLNGLKAINECDIVLIHDGARPFVDNKTIDEGIKYAKIYGACTCGIKPKDTIKIKDENGFSQDGLERDKLFCVQTPQCFKYNLIMKCHERLKQDGTAVTDDTMVVERYGNRVYLYDGSYKNIKITTPEDLQTAEMILKYKSLTD